MDMDTGKFYFIEVNPRIQVEHTVTEVVTGIDIVKAQIHILDGFAIGTPESGVPKQEDIRLNGHALQCRITTEDPEQNFIPDYGRITAYRSASPASASVSTAARPIRARSSPASTIRCWSRSPPGRRRPQEAIARMDRALREFRIRGVATNLTFLEAIITPSEIPRQQLHDPLHRHDAGAVPAGQAPGPRHQAADLSRRRHRQRPSGSQGPADAERRRPPKPVVPYIDGEIADGTKQQLDELGPKKFAEWMRAEKRVLMTDTTMRDGHQSLLATRVRTYRYRPRRRHLCPGAAATCSRSNAGAARPSTSPCAS